MIEKHLPPSHNLLQHPKKVSRRTILKLGGLTAGAVAFNKVNWLTEKTGEVLDKAISPEKIIQGQIPVLEPRRDTTPLVKPQLLEKPTTTHAEYSDANGHSILHLQPDSSWKAEHTDTPVVDTELTAAGTAIITTAEGLIDGEQAYCSLYRGASQTMAIGYEGGVYVYEPGLRKNGQEGGEWVRVVTKAQDDEPPSPLRTSWQNPTTPNHMLIENVVQGTRTLHDLGYKPWPAVLPSTNMPDMVPKELTADICAKNIDEVLDPAHEKKQFYTKNGDIVDIIHLQAKAGETFDLFVQLQYMRLSGDPQPVAGARYSAGNDVRFTYTIDPESLKPENLYDTAFAVMSNTSLLMEGVSQRYIFEKEKLVDAYLPDMGGLSSEDPFTNSLGIVGMLTLIRDEGLLETIEPRLRELQQKNPGVPTSDMYLTLEAAFRTAKDTLANQVVAETAHGLGVREPREYGTFPLPRGLSPLVSTKIHDEDAATPTRINLKAADINPNNSAVHFKNTYVPAMETTLLRFLEEFGM